MNETPPYNDSVHQTILRKISRLRGLTIASVSLNGLILFLLLLACVAHHRHHHHHMGPHGFGGGFERHEDGRFHEHGFQGGDRDQFHGDRFGGDRGGDRFDHHDGGNGGDFGRPPGDSHDFDGKRQPPTPEEMSNRILDHLNKQLTLTDDEKAKIKPLLLDQATQMQKDREAQHAAMKKAMDDTKAKIRAFLTPDQQKQLDQAAQEPASGTPPPPAPPQQ